MKKALLLVLSIVIVSASLIGCKKSKISSSKNVNTQQTSEVKSKQETEIDNNELSADELSALTEEPVSKSTSQINSSSNKNNTKIQVVEEDVNYDEMEFIKHDNIIFDCNYVEDATQKQGELTVLMTKVTGTISGLPGTYDLYLPYSLKWKRGDKAIVSYEIAYEGELEGFVRDIKFIQKFSNEYYENRLKEEARIEAEKKAEEERIAEEERLAKEEEERKKEQQRIWTEKQKKQREEQLAAEEAARLAAEEAARKAEEESRAAEEAKKSKVIGPRA